MNSDIIYSLFVKSKYKGTGSHEDVNSYKIVTYPFGKYEVKIRLTNDDKFIDVIEIKINKDFLSHASKARPMGYHDVDKYYSE